MESNFKGNLSDMATGFRTRGDDKSRLRARKAGGFLIQGAGRSRIIVDMSGFRSDRGDALVALYKTPAGFPGDPQKAFAGRVTGIRGGRAQAVFEDLEPGSYAVAVLHDDNRSQKMETNLLGIPKKGIGISNNPRLLFGPPTFDQTSFFLGPESRQVDVTMKYFL